MLSKLTVLFLCTSNSCRSQMAEGFARQLRADSLEPHSAGTAPGRLDPRAVTVMAECGVDIRGQYSKQLDELSGIVFDRVVTVCSDADAGCPAFGEGTHVIHVGFDDPPRLAAAADSEDEALEHYRRVRDEIRDFIERLPAELNNATT